MIVPLRYGRGVLEVTLPDDHVAGVLRMHNQPSLPDVEAAVGQALRHPLGAPPLRDLAQGKTSACVVICDVTRPVPNAVLLPPLLRELEAAGIAREHITLLVATGLHRPNEGDELEEMIGARLAAEYRVVNHVARDEAQQVSLGCLDDGTPVAVNREYVAADLRLVVGLVEPHLMAGYSGGRKVVCPGIASLDTIRAFHHPRMIEPAEASPGILANNPIHAFSLAVARRARVDFNLCVTLDEQRRVTGVAAGELEAAHLAGVQLANQLVRVEIDAPADVVVTSSAGYPLDTTFYQSIKGLVGALPAVKEGGVIVLAASMTQGVGSEDFVRLLEQTESFEQFSRDLWRDDFFCIDQWQLQELVKVLRKVRAVFYTDGLSAADRATCQVPFADSVEAAVTEALAAAGRDATLLAIPEGPYVLPVVKT